jgi:hypothetical protein
LDNVNFALLERNDGKNQFDGVSKRRIQQSTKILDIQGITKKKKERGRGRRREREREREREMRA